MKKVVSIVIVIAVSFCYVCGVVAYCDVEGIYKTGDVNVDGCVNLGDVSIMLKSIAGWRGNISSDAYADFNGDGNVNISDVSLLLKFIAGWNVVLCPPDVALQKIADDYAVYIQEKDGYDPNTAREFFVAHYYGEYDGAIPVMLKGGGYSYYTVLWIDNVSGSDIYYNDSNEIRVYVNGEFFSMKEAYEAEYLTVNQVKKIADIHNENVGLWFEK